MKTIYIRRATEDMDIDDAMIAQKGFDLVIGEGGLIELARRLGCQM
jgi:2-haloacid dehalogenase